MGASVQSRIFDPMIFNKHYEDAERDMLISFVPAVNILNYLTLTDQGESMTAKKAQTVVENRKYNMKTCKYIVKNAKKIAYSWKILLINIFFSRNV